MKSEILSHVYRAVLGILSEAPLLSSKLIQVHKRLPGRTPRDAANSVYSGFLSSMSTFTSCCDPTWLSSENDLLGKEETHTPTPINANKCSSQNLQTCSSLGLRRCQDTQVTTRTRTCVRETRTSTARSWLNCFAVCGRKGFVS